MKVRPTMRPRTKSKSCTHLRTRSSPKLKTKTKVKFEEEVEAGVEEKKEDKDDLFYRQRQVLYEKGYGFFAEDDRKSVSEAC